MSTKMNFTKRKAVVIVLALAALLLFVIFLRWNTEAGHDLSTVQGRKSFLLELGWEISDESEECKTVLLPESLSGIMADYNRMQQAQGYDLSAHLGERCQQYSYRVTNYPDEEQTVFVTLYVQGKKLIAADIHSTALNGFMHGIRHETN